MSIFGGAGDGDDLIGSGVSRGIFDGGDNFQLAGTLDGIAFESEFVSTALADNFDFVRPAARRAP